MAQTYELREERDRRFALVAVQRAPLGMAVVIDTPDATPMENRAIQTKRGMYAKNKLGGRPILTRERFRKRWLSMAQELREKGWSLRKIAKEISSRGGRPISHEGIAKWLRKPVSTSLDDFQRER